MEIWKNINGFDDYQISNLGRVKSLSRKVYRSKGYYKTIIERILKPLNHSGGYLMVDMKRDKVSNRFLIHRLVAEHFLDNPKNKREVNHKNGNKKDNSADNLEWCTPSENQLHSYRVLNRVRPYKHIKAA